MSSKQSAGEIRKSMVQLTVTVEPHLTEMPHLQEPHQELKQKLTEIDSLSIQQAAQRATVQETTLALRQKTTEAKALALRLRAGVTSFFGNRAERLIEFGIRPRRRRTGGNPAEKPPEINGTQTGPTRGTK